MVGRIVLNRSSMKSTNKMPSPSRFSICSFFSYSCFNPSKNSVAFLLFPLAGQLRANGFLLPFPIFIVTDYSVINAVSLVKISLDHRVLLPPEHPYARLSGYVTIHFPSVQVIFSCRKGIRLHYFSGLNISFQSWLIRFPRHAEVHKPLFFRSRPAFFAICSEVTMSG